jgi:flagellar biosynthesis protein
MTYGPSKKAVAIEYGKKSVPMLTAKGQDELADAIVAEAQRQGVHIAKDPQLVALLSQLDLDREVPENLYVAVAVILSWVYWLKGIEPEGYSDGTSS